MVHVIYFNSYYILDKALQMPECYVYVKSMYVSYLSGIFFCSGVTKFITQPVTEISSKLDFRFTETYKKQHEQINHIQIQHYSDAVMGAMASQITSLTIIYSTVYAGAHQRKTSKFRVTGLCEGNSPVTGEFPAQMTSNTEMFPFDDVIMSINLG